MMKLSKVKMFGTNQVILNVDNDLKLLIKIFKIYDNFSINNLQYHYSL